MRTDRFFSQVIEVMEHIEDGNILPPLIVLQILAKNSSLKVAIVKNYVARQLHMENIQIQKDRETIKKLQTETENMKIEVDKLTTKACSCDLVVMMLWFLFVVYCRL